MKRALLLIMVLVLCIGMCACGVSEEDVKSKLIRGKWEFIDNYKGKDNDSMDGLTGKVKKYYFSNNNQCEYITIDYYGGWNLGASTTEGTYTIEKNEIIITDEEGRDRFLEYTYRNGKLSLFLNEDGKKIQFVQKDSENE